MRKPAFSLPIASYGFNPNPIQARTPIDLRAPGLHARMSTALGKAKLTVLLLSANR